jgi:hypothetical protein
LIDFLTQFRKFERAVGATQSFWRIGH